MNDELTAYKGDVTIPVYGTIADTEVYLKEDADTAIAEKDELITSLQDTNKVLAHNGVRLNKMLDEKDKEIDELKDKLRHYPMMVTLLESDRKDIADLKAKLESVQASMYCDVVDANMENRRLRRALWLARAKRADDRARIFYFNDLETILDIDGYSYDSKKKKSCTKLAARDWRIIWLEVERKCRAKAEEYR